MFDKHCEPTQEHTEKPGMWDQRAVHSFKAVVPSSTWATAMKCSQILSLKFFITHLLSQKVTLC